MHTTVRIATFGFLSIGAALGQSESIDYRITTQSELVLLDVGVKNAKGENVLRLTKDNFRIYENGKLQIISDFSNEDLPATTGLILDSSGSMIAKRADVLNGGLVFIHASNPTDEMFIADFNDRVNFRLPPGIPFSRDQLLLRDALLSVHDQGRTALYDAVYESLLHLKSSKQERKALILISDGGDNCSRHNLRDVIAAARESLATIYSIGMFDADDPDRNPGLLKNLAHITGGQTFFPGQISEVIDICREIARDIRSRYTIGYRPVRRNDQAELRSLTVKLVDTEKATVRARTVYQLPARLSGEPR